MSGRRRHPGYTGVAPWIPWALSEEQRSDLRAWFRSWKADWIDEAGMLEAVEGHIHLYLRLKALAEMSSAGAVRKNLKGAVRAAQKLVVQVSRLDGNSLQLLRQLPPDDSLLDDALQIHDRLKAALDRALIAFPTRGPRPAQERNALAALLADAMRNYSSIRPTATRGGIFEDLLRQAFELAGERYEDLHTLAERVLARELVSRPQDGLLSIDTC